MAAEESARCVLNGWEHLHRGGGLARGHLAEHERDERRLLLTQVVDHLLRDPRLKESGTEVGGGGGDGREVGEAEERSA